MDKYKNETSLYELKFNGVPPAYVVAESAGEAIKCYEEHFGETIDNVKVNQLKPNKPYVGLDAWQIVAICQYEFGVGVATLWHSTRACTNG